MAIQLIINKELGLAKGKTQLQGSYVIEELTDLVEEAVLLEFDRINERGCAWSNGNNVSRKIQEESFTLYETITWRISNYWSKYFFKFKGSPTIVPDKSLDAKKEKRDYQINMLNNLHENKSKDAKVSLRQIQNAAINQENIFEVLMEACKHCSFRSNYKRIV